MTATSEPVVLAPRRPYPGPRGLRATLIYRVITTTDHKLIGIMYGTCDHRQR